ncbi:MAG: hypothetical protein K2W95_05300 [Candidatus Obscuribacterales bacterium]|nr:hypothetical protein [Candidatus Obscuribacterales bacterium]
MPQPFSVESDSSLHTNQSDLLANRPNVAVEAVQQGLYCAAYAGLQSPVQGLAQLVDRTTGAHTEKSVTLMEAPPPAEFGTAKWHAQQVGSAAGMLAPFMLVAKGTHAAVGRIAGVELAATEATATSLLSGRNGRLVAESALAGFVYDSILRPVTDAEIAQGRMLNGKDSSGPVTNSEFWAQRLKHGIGGAATFGTLTASTLALKQYGIGKIAGRGEQVLNGALAGLPAGLVNAETNSLLHTGKLAGSEELVKSAYTMSFIGGAMGALPNPFEAARPKLGEKSAERIATDKTAATKTEASDATLKAQDQVVELPGKILPENSLSMRELAERDPAQMREVLKQYYPELEAAFPLEGEIETTDTYEAYLTDPESTWDMVVLRDSENSIIGGIQYQVLDVPGTEAGKVAWAEHIWVKQENRDYGNFRSLLNVAKQRIADDGAKMVFMEFNNPKKMTPEEIAIDAEGGITTQDRAKIWGRVGIHVVVDSKGNIAEYGQPSMDGQPSVEYLSLGFVGLEPITGQTISVRDYIQIAQTAHKTIPGCDLNTDPTVQKYTSSVLQMGEPRLRFKPLMELVREEQQGNQ